MKIENRNYDYYKKEEKPFVKLPLNTAHLIEIQKVYEDGIFYHGRNRYSRSFAFTDNNYPLYDEDEKDEKLDIFANFFRGLAADLQLSVINLMPEDVKVQQPVCNSVYERELMEIIQLDRLMAEKKLKTVKLLTITIEAVDYTSARTKLSNLEMGFYSSFSNLESIIKPIDCDDRLGIFYLIHHPGMSVPQFDSLDKKFVREALALHSFGYDKELVWFKTSAGKQYAALFYIKDFADSLSDKFLSELRQMPYRICYSEHTRPLPKKVAVEKVKNMLMFTEKGINEEQDRNNHQGHYRSSISYNRRTSKQDIEDMLDDMRDKDRLSIASFTIAVFANTKEDLAEAIKNLYKTASEYSVDLAQHTLKLREAYVTALPYGLRMTKTLRPMFSSALAALNPFEATDLQMQGRKNLYMGTNKLTGEPILVNPKKLMTTHAVIVGKSGSGKSLFNKFLKSQVFHINRTDEIFILDPMSEHKKLADAYGGSFYDLGGGAYRFNPLVPTGTRVDDGFVRRKSLYMNSIMELIMKGSFTYTHLSVLEKCMREFYQGNDYRFSVLIKLLENTRNSYAEELALAMERLTEGTLNIFSDRQETFTPNRLTVFGLSAAKTDADTTALTMMTMIDYLTDRITDNFARGITTWVDIDEIQRIIKQTHAAMMVQDFWQTARKLKTICTAITPTVRGLCQTEAGRSIISNSGLKAAFKLEKGDRDDVMELFGINETQINYLKAANTGCAVLKIDDSVVLTNLHFTEKQQKTKLYELISTNPYEKEESFEEE